MEVLGTIAPCAMYIPMGPAGQEAPLPLSEAIGAGRREGVGGGVGVGGGSKGTLSGGDADDK